jgi:hypothetical protein
MPIKRHSRKVDTFDSLPAPRVDFDSENGNVPRQVWLFRAISQPDIDFWC